MSKRITLVLLLALVAPGSVAGQSLFSAVGLGFPMEPLDARSIALGGVGVGLRGATILGTDPASAARILVPVAVMTAQPSWVDFGRKDSNESGSFRGSRFPSMGIAYPAWNYGIVTLSFESAFDQRYRAERVVSLDLREGPVEAKDEFISEGGISQARFGFARAVGERLSLGLSLGRYTGSVTRSLERGVPEDSLSSAVNPFADPYETGGRWGYSGTSLTGGARLALGTVGHVGGSVTWSGGLNAEASDDSDGDDRSFDIPLQVRIGASALLAPGLSLSAGYSSADWSGIDDDLALGSSVGRVASFGGGIELTRATLFGRRAPLRVGYRHRDLPFTFQGGAPTETAWTGGLGLALNEVGELVRAGLDLALERGERTSIVINEKFWRASLTLRVAGF
jgi:hypothetical protein